MPEDTEPAPADPNPPPDPPADQPEAGAKATSADPDADLSTDDTRTFQQGASVINNFIGDVSADNASFGMAGGAVSARRATGVIKAERVSAQLRGYVRPDGFAAAVAVLRKEHLLVLTGAEGIGKRTGAIAVLAEALGMNSIVSLPPTRSLMDLGKADLQEGRGYLVQDWSGDDASSSAQRFDLDQLRRALEKSYLVLTCRLPHAQRRLFDGVIVDWSAPDPLAVLDACPMSTSDELTGTERERLRERVATLSRPSDVVGVATRAREGVDTAFEFLGVNDRQRVATWFEDKPAPRSLLATAALCFLDGTPDLEFQSLLSLLVRLVNEHATLDTVTRSVGDSAPAGAFPQHDGGEQPLDVVGIERSADGDQTDQRVRRFVSPPVRRAVIEMLVDRYGFELWEPLRDWIDEVAALPSWRRQVRLAFGVALLYRHAPDTVQDLLGQWADGVVGQRFAAAFALSWMCLDDSMAPFALRTAQGWTAGAGTRRATTAAMAFGGELGIRYQNEALNKLWYLAMRSQMVSRHATDALAQLLCSAVQDADTAASMLRFLRSVLRKLIDDAVGVPAGGDYYRQVAKALDAIRLVLCAVPGGSGESVSATILRTLPGCTALLGELWAEVLRSARHRGTAVMRLCEVLDVLRDDYAGMSVIAEFGTAIRRHLSDEENRLLRRQLAVEWNERENPRSTLLVTELINALGARAARKS